MAEVGPARVLLIEDETTYRELLERRLAQSGYQTTGVGTGEEGLAQLMSDEFDVAVVDLALPGISGIEVLKRLRDSGIPTEAIMLTGHGSIGTAVEAMQLGAYHYLEKPIKLAKLVDSIDKAFEKRRLTVENRDLKEVVQRKQKAPVLVGDAPIMERLRVLLGRVAAAPTAVLIEGETGTGKDVCSRLIHAASPRSNGPYIAINCGALPETLLNSELFGHVKGAFTGATETRRGVFEMADRGTLFIDEVCEMSMEIQKKFLRILENGEFRRLGDSKIRSADVRIIAATNRRMKEEVAAGRFREDLYYRLNVLSVETPPLREHRQDIPALIECYLSRNAGRYRRSASISPEVLRVFARYGWPGNVRELNAVVERGVVLSSDGVVILEDIPGIAAAPLGNTPPPSSSADEGLTLEELERRHVDRILGACNGNKTLAAQRLGISLRSLYRKIEKFG